jgi:ribosomal-protein-alanine N-acetyltransferase
MDIYRVGPVTRRLEHRAFTLEDSEAFFALNSHPEVMRLTGEPPLEHLDDARAAIASYPDFDQVGYGRWACVLKDSQTVIGFCGLKHLPEFDEVDVGYRFLPQYWGQGFATEACSASVAFGFDVLKLQRIVGFVLPDNSASIRVLEKVGMLRDGEVIYDGQKALRFAIGRTSGG